MTDLQDCLREIQTFVNESCLIRFSVLDAIGRELLVTVNGTPILRQCGETTLDAAQALVMRIRNTLARWP